MHRLEMLVERKPLTGRPGRILKQHLRQRVKGKAWINIDDGQ